MARNKKGAQRASQLKGTPSQKDSKNDLIEDIITFLTPYYEQRRVPKRLVNVVILIRSAFPGRSIDKATVKKAYAKAGWDASVLCNLTNNELANAIEAGELDKSYDETPFRVKPVPKRRQKESNKVDASQLKIPPQPATGSRLGFPEGYFETTYIAGPQTRYGKAYPSMFYNDIEKELKAKKALPKAGRGLSKVPVPSSNVNNGISFKDANDPCRIIAAKHARHQHERVMIRKTQLGVKSILDIITKLNNKKDMPTKINRVRDLIRSENPGVMVRTSMITKAYQRLGWNKKNRVAGRAMARKHLSATKSSSELASPPENFKHKTIKPSHHTPQRFPKKKNKSQSLMKHAMVNDKKRRKPVKYATAEKFYGTMTARKHRTMREAAEAALEEKKQRNAINKKLSVAMRRLNSRRRNK